MPEEMVNPLQDALSSGKPLQGSAMAKYLRSQYGDQASEMQDEDLVKFYLRHQAEKEPAIRNLQITVDYAGQTQLPTDKQFPYQGPKPGVTLSYASRQAPPEGVKDTQAWTSGPIGKPRDWWQELLSGQPEAVHFGERLAKGTTRPEAKFAAGFAQGLAKTGVNLTDPANVALLGSAEGLRMLATKAGGKYGRLAGLLSKWAGRGFKASMLVDLLPQIPEAYQAFKAGDQVAAGDAVARAVADLVLIGAPGKPAKRAAVGETVRPAVAAPRSTKVTGLPLAPNATPEEIGQGIASAQARLSQLRGWLAGARKQKSGQAAAARLEKQAQYLEQEIVRMRDMQRYRGAAGTKEIVAPIPAARQLGAGPAAAARPTAAAPQPTAPKPESPRPAAPIAAVPADSTLQAANRLSLERYGKSYNALTAAQQGKVMAEITGEAPAKPAAKTPAKTKAAKPAAPPPEETGITPQVLPPEFSKLGPGPLSPEQYNKLYAKALSYQNERLRNFALSKLQEVGKVIDVKPVEPAAPAPEKIRAGVEAGKQRDAARMAEFAPPAAPLPEATPTAEPTAKYVAPIQAKISDPLIKQIAKTSFPDYKGRTVSVLPFRPQQVNAYWDEGSRSDFSILDLDTMKSKGMPSSHPFYDVTRRVGNQPFENEAVSMDRVGNITLKKLPPNHILVEHQIFQGKDIGLKIHADPENLTKFLPEGKTAGGTAAAPAPTPAPTARPPETAPAVPKQAGAPRPESGRSEPTAGPEPTGRWQDASNLPQWKDWPWRRATGDRPHTGDTPPERTKGGDYVLYHGTSLSNAQKIADTRNVTADNFGAVGVNTSASNASTYATMKAVQEKSEPAVLRLVVDKNWMHKQELAREVGGSGRDAWLIEPDLSGKKLNPASVPSDAIKEVSIETIHGERNWKQDHPDLWEKYGSPTRSPAKISTKTAKREAAPAKPKPSEPTPERMETYTDKHGVQYTEMDVAESLINGRSQGKNWTDLYNELRSRGVRENIIDRAFAKVYREFEPPHQVRKEKIVSGLASIAAKKPKLLEKMVTGREPRSSPPTEPPPEPAYTRISVLEPNRAYTVTADNPNLGIWKGDRLVYQKTEGGTIKMIFQPKPGGPQYPGTDVPVEEQAELFKYLRPE